MSSINRNPLGWLGFLGIKNFGRNPTNAADILAPTWELSDLYLNAAVRYQEVAGSLTAAGKFNGFTVPGGKVWYVLQFSVRSDVPTGATPALQLACQLTAQSNLTTVNVSQVSERITSNNGRAMACIERPLIAQPGEILGAYVSEFVSAAAINCSYAIRYAELDA